MGCTHEIKQGSVVTVINAGGPPGCSFCREDALRAENERLREALGELQYHVDNYVRANSTLKMSGREYGSPSIKTLANALAESRTLPSEGDGNG